jgi:hypothetical protein
LRDLSFCYHNAGAGLPERKRRDDENLLAAAME